MENITARQYYKGQSLNALIMKGSEEILPDELIRLASKYADLMLEEDGSNKIDGGTW